MFVVYILVVLILVSTCLCMASENWTGISLIMLEGCVVCVFFGMPSSVGEGCYAISLVIALVLITPFWRMEALLVMLEMEDISLGYELKHMESPNYVNPFANCAVITAAC